MSAALKLTSGHYVAASDAARRARQKRRTECPRARTGTRYLTEPEMWAFFDTVSRARQRVLK